MKIVTENLKSLAGIWNQTRVSGIEAYSYVFLDFNNSQIKFMNEKIAVKANLILLEKEEHKTMFVEGNKFFSLVNFYNTLEIVDNVFYSPKHDKIQIPIIDEDLEFPDRAFNDWTSQKINFSANVNKVLSSSLDYIDKDDSRYSTLYFTQGYAIALNPKKTFFGNIGDAITSDFNIPYPLLKMILSFKMDGEVEFKVRTVPNGASMIEFNYNNIWIRYEASSEYVMPIDPMSDKFTSSFYHENYFVVETEELGKVLSFMNEFFRDVDNPIVRCTFKIDDSGEFFNISIYNKDFDSGSIEYNVKIDSMTDKEYFADKVMPFYLNSLKLAYNTAHSFGFEKTLLRFKENAPGVFFGSEDQNNMDVYVVHTLIR